MSKLTYIRCGDYDIPNLKLSEQPETSIGKYGRMRKSYLKEHRPILYNQLLMSEKLYPHLLEIARTAQERVDTMFCQCFSCQTLCLSCSFDICAEGFKTGTIFNFRHITSPDYIV